MFSCTTKNLQRETLFLEFPRVTSRGMCRFWLSTHAYLICHTGDAVVAYYEPYALQGYLAHKKLPSPRTLQ